MINEPVPPWGCMRDEMYYVVRTLYAHDEPIPRGDVCACTCDTHVHAGSILKAFGEVLLTDCPAAASLTASCGGWSGPTPCGVGGA